MPFSLVCLEFEVAGDDEDVFATAAHHAGSIQCLDVADQRHATPLGLQLLLQVRLAACQVVHLH